MKKILFFLFGGVGGAERMTINYGKMLPLDKYKVKYVICGRKTDILRFIPQEYDVLFIKWRNIHIFPILRLSKVILREKPDFVFSSTLQLNIKLLQASNWMNVPCVVRNDNMLNYVNEHLRNKLIKYYPLAYKIIGQTEEMQDDIIQATGLDLSKVICLHNPIDVNIIKGKISSDNNPYPNDGSVNYVWVANFLPSKGHDILIKAFEIVHDKNSKTHLYLVGKTQPGEANYERVHNLVSKSKACQYIHFTGLQSNPYIWMKYANCFVLPSRIEGLPNTLLEAMYLQTPVVASICIPIIDRIIVNGYNGYKVLPDHPEEMAEAMEKAILLNNFKMTYQGATMNDVIALFQ